MFEEVHEALHWTPPEFRRNLNENSLANRHNWHWSDFSDVADSLVASEVNHRNAFDDCRVEVVNESLPILAARIESFVNERTFGMWGDPTSPEMLFVIASATSRPLMIVARTLTPLAWRCAQTGEKPELKTLFGVGEFLYPRVLTTVKKRLADPAQPAPKENSL